MTPRPPFSPPPGRRVSAADIEAWQRALTRRPSRASGRKLLALAFFSLAAASLLWSRTGATAGCPDPSPALPSPLTKFCPDTPAYAEDMNQNFAQLTSWLTKFAGAVGSPIEANWVKSNNIQPAAINTTHLADNAVQGTHIKDGSINGAKLVEGTVTKDKLNLPAPSNITTFRRWNPACSIYTANQAVQDLPTCPAAPCPGAVCPNGQQHFYQCDTTNCSSSCSSIPPSCTNPIAGYLIP